MVDVRLAANTKARALAVVCVRSERNLLFNRFRVKKKQNKKQKTILLWSSLSLMLKPLRFLQILLCTMRGGGEACYFFC
jgi:hypothetical protein